jgi:hypothetical protein
MPRRSISDAPVIRQHGSSNAEKYVIALRNAQALWSNLSAEERKEAEEGLRWAEVFGQIYTGPKIRGRPPGSKNRLAQVPIPDGLSANNAAQPVEDAPMFEEHEQ